MIDTIEETPGDARAVAAGRILCGGPPVWPGGEEMGFLQAWPGHRRLAGLRLQSLADLGASRALIAEAAATVLPAPAFDAEARDFSRDFSRYFVSAVFPGHPELGEAPWAADFALGELYSYGRVMLPAILANFEGDSDMPVANLLRPACRLYFHSEEDTEPLDQALAEFPAKGDELWPAMARHIARRSTKADRTLLDNLAREPENRKPPLQWGLQYIVRGDVVLDDGTVVTLDELAHEVGMAPLEYIEHMPEHIEIDWEESD